MISFLNFIIKNNFYKNFANIYKNKKVLIIGLDFNELIREIGIVISSPLKYLDLLGKLVEAEVIPFLPYNSNFSRILV